MKKLLAITVILGLLAIAPTAGASTICPVDVDTYALFCSPAYGYPINYEVKSMSGWAEGIPVYAFIKFDLSSLSSHTGDDVIWARFKFYRLAGGAPAGVNFTATIQALDNTVPLTESLLPGEDPDNCLAHGVINYYTKPETIGEPFPVSNNTGPNTWAEADITQIVKDWLDGLYENNGIRFHDNDDLFNDYVWTWASRYDTVGSSCKELHPGEKYSPYLEVNLVPIPGTVLLFGSGLLGLIGIRRRKK